MQRTTEVVTTEASTDRAQRLLFWHRKQRKRAASPHLSEHYRRYLEDVGAFLVLPKSTTDALLPIYTASLDDLIPIMDGASVVRDQSNGQSSNYLVRAICLVVCKSKQASPFLQLVEGGPILEPLEFASKLLEGLDAAVKANLEPDRVTKIQILTLMHLHNDGLAGVDRSSSYLSQAICEAWSISLHLKVPGSPEQKRCDFLWWTLRNFDRLNKPIMAAAPFMIDDTDVAVDRISPREDDYRSQVMSISLTLGDLMTTATRVYKASSKATVDLCDDFPSLSELTSGTAFERFHRSHAAYLEIWYHVAAMLSCRYSGPGRPQYSRRLASADRVISIISQEGSERLPPLPLIPYAISMATTVIYRALRDERRNTSKACEDLGLCCNALEILSERWTSVKGVARLAKRLLRFIDRGITQVQLGDKNECLCRDCGSHGTAVSAVSRPLEIAPEGRNETVHILQPTTPIPCLVDSSQTLHQENGAGIDQLVQLQPGDSWENFDVSYTQLDRAFHDMFDDGMPDVFRDPAAWDFIEVPNEAYSHWSTQ
ncbi:uncharacterized protein CTRU02_213439 [Colletotrichum truncatum]|uniref:Uncharacterized protein n=1 Tax=Colletotrichum truncatum TaxID=5467 RepID=A0ACC3YKQ6_COLTU